MAANVEMNAQDKHCLSSILFAAGYRGTQLESEIQRRVKLDPTGHVIELDLTCCDFMEIPPAIGYLFELRSLDMTYCKRITALPKEMGKLINLKKLDMYCCNNLKQLPPEMGRLRALEMLDLFGCLSLTLPPKDARTAKTALPFLHSLLNLRDYPSTSIGLLRSDARLLYAAAKDPSYANSLAKAIEADKSLALLPIEANGRNETVLSIACPECRAAIESVLYFYRRYEIEGAAAYDSHTALIVHALDHGSSSNPNDSDGFAQPVVLKFFRNKNDFMTEKKARICEQNGGAQCFFQEYIIPALQYHDGDDDHMFRIAAQALHLPHYCIVLERGDRGLLEAVLFERNLSGNVDESRSVLEYIAKAIAHMHQRGFIHGKLNFRNIVRSPTRGGKYAWRLIDLSSAVPLGNVVCGNMISSAHSPPEAVAVMHNTSDQGVLVAHPSYDVWSYGTIMFRLLARVPLIEGTDDNGALLHEGISNLQKWNEVSLKGKLSLISDSEARDLLSHILQADPEKRPSMEQVLGHAFYRESSYMSQ